MSTQFEVVTTCAGIEFSYRMGDIITLGVDITDETARDLVKAGHIRVHQPVERATEVPVETAMKTTTPVERKTARKPVVEKDS
jgi:hypothetical protein